MYQVVFVQMKCMAHIWILLSGLWTIAYGSVASNGRKLATCPAGSIADSSGKYCCPISCGQCGGRGCEKRPGGAKSCCTNKISKSCDKRSAPCIASNHESDCPVGGIASSNGKACCPASCGKCGGAGCNMRPGGDTSCCTGKVKTFCGTGVLPCLRDEDKSQNDAYCSNGMEGYEGTFAKQYLGNACEIKVCCPKSCGTCNTNFDCSLAEECCATRLGFTSGYDIEVSCRNRDPPCIVPYPDDECIQTPCQNEARCAIIYGSSDYESPEEDTCLLQQWCFCDELENYSGEYCQIKCGEGETPCGFQSIDSRSSSKVANNNKCCTVNEECVEFSVEGGGSAAKCFPYKRPRNCSATFNPCLNGGKCLLVNKIDYGYPGLYECSCPVGFEGTYCEIET